MTWSRFTALLAFLAGFSSAILAFARVVSPRHAAVVEAVAILLTAFNERLQGGKSVATTKDVVDNKDAKRISPLA
jgi:hypothetical protein